jgi:putative ATP-dependent endonuclease of OLD family
MIADLKQNVIFAMEEPEIAIPPHTQKRIINSVINKSAQAIFTSHSPYVLEEFKPEQIMVVSRKDGELTGCQAKLPPAVKQKMYRDEVKRRFCEALLARRVLIVEGRTEYDTYSRLAKRLQELEPENYSSLEGLGIAVISAETDSQISTLGEYFKSLGKVTYAVYDKQDASNSTLIKNSVDYAYESSEKGFENVLLKGIPEAILRQYAQGIVKEGLWPSHLGAINPTTDDFTELQGKLLKYFSSKKTGNSVADCLCMCSINELPTYILKTLKSIRNTVVAESISPSDEAADIDEFEE